MNMTSRDRYLNEEGETISLYAKTFGCFTRQQAYLMSDKHYTTVDKVLAGMVKGRKLFQDKGDSNYFIANPKALPDHKMIRCLWIMLFLKGDEKINTEMFWFGRAKKPSYISYVKGGTLYDVVPVNKGDNNIMKFIENQNDLEVENAEDIKHNYIIAVPSVSALESLTDINVPHMFAVVKDITPDLYDYENKKFVEIDLYESEV